MNSLPFIVLVAILDDVIFSNMTAERNFLIFEKIIIFRYFYNMAAYVLF